MERRLFGKRLQSHGKRELCLGGVVREWIMSGRVYSLKHTAAANTHAHTHGWRNGRSRTHRGILRNKRALFFFCQRDKTWTIQNLTRTKQINTAALHRIMDTHTHTQNHKVSYHTNCVWLNSRGERECVCVCVCAPSWTGCLFMTQSPAFSAQNSVSSAFTKAWAIRSKPPGLT